MLQALVRRRDGLIEMRVQEDNRAAASRVTAVVQSSIDEHVDYLNESIREIERKIADLVSKDPDSRSKSELLQSIPGVGQQTANAILAELPNISEFRDVKAIAAYAGLSPRHNQSGLSPGRSRLCKAGNASLRKALYFPAITAIRVNPTIKSFAARLALRGKRKMVIIAAAMRKLLIIAYGVSRAAAPSKAWPLLDVATRYLRMTRLVWEGVGQGDECARRAAAVNPLALSVGIR